MLASAVVHCEKYPAERVFIHYAQQNATSIQPSK